uniref:PROLIXIN S, nitrophorin 2, NP2=ANTICOAGULANT (Fragments) n=1 Tax=Rhodnius prolixus TaxID=13249 RepID=Q9TXF7_RHOPR
DCSTNISPKQGLDKAKYFSGKKYVTHFLDKDPQVTDQYESSFTPEGSKDLGDLYTVLTHQKSAVTQAGLQLSQFVGTK